MTNNSTPERVLALKQIFADSPIYFDLENQVLSMLEQRRVEINEGVTNEARGVALIGASGSGKTTIVNRLIKSLSKRHQASLQSDECEILSFPVPSPATLKFVGQRGLQAIGYPLRRDKTSHIIWDMFKEHLHARKTLILHLDEAQDLSLNQTAREMQSVINTLKSLMQNQEWPVSIILSGMPILKDMLNHDPQLARRFIPFELPKLNAVHDADQILHLIAYYAKHADLGVDEDLLSDEFSARLIHAADGEFGLLIETTISAIEVAFRSGCAVLGLIDFKEAFSRKAGCIDALNPFVASDFERIDCRKLLGGSN